MNNEKSPWYKKKQFSMTFRWTLNPDVQICYASYSIETLKEHIVHLDD